MLSYQHSYHAGNMADVHKHAVMAVMLDYLTRKDKPFSYIDSHAGRGLYDLGAEPSLKTGEAAAGIAVAEAAGWFDADHPYAKALATVRAKHGPSAYPGSPLLAAQIMRRTDKMRLAELHPQEAAGLQDIMSDFPAVIERRDGLEMALSICPPDPARGLLLIDPSYEVKDEYLALPPVLKRIHKHWKVGILMLWYPILTRGAHVPMVEALRAALPEGICHEVPFPPAREGHGMIGSGLFIVNPTYGLQDELARLSALYCAL